MRCNILVSKTSIKNMSEDDDYIKALEIQRRNFEAQFGSIETLGYEDKSKSASNGIKDIDSSEEEEEEDNFEGFQSGEESEDYSSSSSEDDESYSNGSAQVKSEVIRPKVFKLNDPNESNKAPMVSKRERKLLKSGRAPTLAEIEKKEELARKQTKKQLLKAGKDDGENIENDLKLQRLLDESHILANSLQYSGADLTLQTIDYEDPTGNARKRALDSRLRKLAAVNSSSEGLPKKLENMPMSMRKGMIRSRDMKVAKFEKEAKEAGIVLSKVKKGELRDLKAGRGFTSSADRLGTGKKVTKVIRDRGLKIASIGRSTRNGLVIPQSQIDKINNQGRRSNSKGKGKGKRR
ncbi:hypothetical protein DFJ63DRAFT_320140 [Scheffersomyces coipomensis]|uniref:uncharacterized protein n=1 Tax=Scheffersomyces coipomensis TaxID=1788519 RepID=UPI00315D1059